MSNGLVIKGKVSVMSMFDKMKAALGNPEVWDTLLSDDFVMSSIRSGNNYGREQVIKWNATAKPEAFELILETDSMLIVQGRDRNQDGVWAYMDAFEHNGDKITSCKVVIAVAEELS